MCQTTGPAISSGRPAAGGTRSRHDPEVAATAAYRPEQVGVLVLARPYELALGGDDVDGEQLVDREPVLARDPADPAAEGQPGQPRVGDKPAGTASPCGGSHGRDRPAGHPPGAAVRAAGSIRMPFIGPRSITIPSSQTDSPGSCGRRPGRPAAAARAGETTAAAKSSGVAHRAIGRAAVDGAVPDPAVLVVAASAAEQAPRNDARSSPTASTGGAACPVVELVMAGSPQQCQRLAVDQSVAVQDGGTGTVRDGGADAADGFVRAASRTSTSAMISSPGRPAP